MTTSSFWCQAAPRGSNVGIVSVTVATGTIAVTVLPKVWSASPSRLHIVPWTAGSTHDITVWETDWIRFDGDETALGQLSLALSSVTRSGPVNLLQPGVPPRDDRVTLRSDPESELGGPLSLVKLVDRCKVDISDFSSSNASGDDEILALPLHDRFLGSLHGPLSMARPRYNELTELLSTPRGRFDTTGAAFAQFAGTPSLSCTFDELSYDTPLLRVILAALRHIALNEAHRHAFRETERLRQQAIHYMKQLSSVAVVDRSQALKLGLRVRPTRFETQWQGPLELATRVLSRSYDRPTASDEALASIHVNIPTAKLWEQIVGEVLRRIDPAVAISADNSAPEGVSVPAPWRLMKTSSTGAIPIGASSEEDVASKSSPDYVVIKSPTVEAISTHASPQEDAVSQRFPDYMFSWQGLTLLADAKYKRSNRPLTSQDGYQLFTYSHLATLRDTPSHSSLVIVPTSGSVPHSPSTERFMRARSKPYSLLKVALPFPGPLDIRTMTEWDSYLTNSADTLNQTLVENRLLLAPSPTLVHST